MRCTIACVTFLVVVITPSATSADVIPLAVHPQGCAFVVDSRGRDDHSYLIVGAIADARQQTRVTIRTEATDAPVDLPHDHTIVPTVWRELVREQAAQQEQARRRQVAMDIMPHTAPRVRQFHVFVSDRDVANPAHYIMTTAELSAVGRHCQVYVDRAAAKKHGLRSLLHEAVRTFDDEVFPWASRHLGIAHDVDRDGRFTILLTPLVGTPRQNGTPVDGYVRGSDFELNGATPFSNRCDMMYLNSRLEPGPHLRAVLAHEYAHAVLYCQHVLETFLPNAAHRDEEGWLNEGLAHVVEAEMGYGWSNLEHRIRAYWAAPERYPLVVPDYFDSGLWRTPGTRGACFLFLQACRQRHGVCLLNRLSRSSLQGVPNLEAATGQRFDEMFREWAVHQLQAGAGWAREAKVGRLCVGPHCHDVRLAGTQHDFAVAGTGLLYLRLHSAASARTRVRIEGAHLQVTLVRPEVIQPWLEVRPGDDGLLVMAHGGDVRLEEAGWVQSRSTAAPGDPQLLRIDPALQLLKAGATVPLRGSLLRMPGGTEATVTIVGRDAAGQMVTGWTIIPPPEARPTTGD